MQPHLATWIRSNLQVQDNKVRFLLENCDILVLHLASEPWSKSSVQIANGEDSQPVLRQLAYLLGPPSRLSAIWLAQTPVISNLRSSVSPCFSATESSFLCNSYDTLGTTSPESTIQWRKREEGNNTISDASKGSPSIKNMEHIYE